MERRMFLYPWELIDNGIEQTAEHLKRMNVTSVSLCVLYHTAKMLLLNNSKRHLYFNDGGTCFYDVQINRYGKLKPVRDKVLNSYSGEFLKDVQESFRKFEIKVCAWVVVFHNDALAKKHPDCAIHNCYGEDSATNLCPSNPEVIDYALRLVEELAEMGFYEIHLESVDYAGFLHGDHHEMQAFEDMEKLEELMGICYCPHCMELAKQDGVDAERLQVLVKQKADDFFHLRKSSENNDEYLRLHQAYLRVKQNQITSFYKKLWRLLKEKHSNTKIKPILWMAGGNDPMLQGVDICKIGKYVDGVIAAYPDTDGQVCQFVKRIRKMVPADIEVTGGIRLMAPNTTIIEQVTNYIKNYRDNGIDDIIFYNYGMAPNPFLRQLEVVGR